jgi:peptidyl-prolyl cis-trans isomerase D
MFGRPISLRDFQKTFSNVRTQAIMRYGENFHQISHMLDLNSETWDRLILLNEAKKQKIKVTDQEVIATIQNFPFFQRNNRFDPALYNQVVQHVFQTKPRDFEEGIREALMIEKIYQHHTDLITVSSEDVHKTYREKNEQAQVDYILFLSQDYEQDIILDDQMVRSYFDEHQGTFRVPPQINVRYVEILYPNEADEQQKSLVNEKAAGLADDLNNHLSLEEIAQAHDLTIKESGFFSQENPNFNIGWPLEIFSHAMSLQENEIKGPIQTDQGFYVIELKDQQPSQVPSYEEVQPQVEQAVRKIEAKKIARQKAFEALEQVRSEIDKNPDASFEAIAKQHAYPVTRSDLFKRGEYLPEIGSSADFHQMAFGLTEDHPLSDPVETNNGYAILSFVSFVPIDEEKFEQEKEALSKDILSRKKEEVFHAFLTQLRTKAQLENYLEKLPKSF